MYHHRVRLAPGTVTTYRESAGLGVRVDSGIEANSIIGGAFDSLLPSSLSGGNPAPKRWPGPAHWTRWLSTGWPPRCLFTARWCGTRRSQGNRSASFTRWIETEFNNTNPAFVSVGADVDAVQLRETVVVEVNGRRLEVSLPAGVGTAPGGSGAGGRRPARRSTRSKAGPAAGADDLTAPMQGTVVKVAVSERDPVEAGDLVVMVEATKMEQPLNAHKAGIITNLAAEISALVTSGAMMCRIVDLAPTS